MSIFFLSLRAEKHLTLHAPILTQFLEKNQQPQQMQHRKLENNTAQMNLIDACLSAFLCNIYQFMKYIYGKICSLKEKRQAPAVCKDY